MREHEFEPVPGLPESLPEGERILWQGSPHWWGLAARAFHARTAIIYFALLMAVRFVIAVADGVDPATAASAATGVLPLAVAAVGLLVLLGWMNAREALYTITTKRVVMRIGVAFPVTINLPFRRIATAGLKTTSGGRGDIALTMAGNDKLAGLMLWPHMRPWHWTKPQASLRAVTDCVHVAGILADALAAETGGIVRAPAREAAAAPPRGIAAPAE